MSSKKNSKNNTNQAVLEDSNQYPYTKNKPFSINLKNLICPFKFEQKDLNYFTLMTKVPKFVRTFFVGTVPRFFKFGESLRSLHQFGNSNTSIYITPIKESVSQSNLNEIIANLETERIETSKKGNAQKEMVLIDKKTEAEFLRDEIATSLNKLFEVSIFTTIFADSIEHLNILSDHLGSETSKELISIKSAWSQQDRAFIANTPCGNNTLPQNNTFDTYSLSALVPFISTDINHTTGIPFGVNNKSNFPIFLDTFYTTFTNYNFLVLGNESSAKHYAIQLLSLRSYALAGIQSAAIDLNGNYSRISESLDGYNINIGSFSKYIINPFDIEIETIKDEITGREINTLNLNKKIEDVTNILATMSRGSINSQYVNEVTIKIIQDTVAEEYSDLGITNNPDTIFSSTGANLVGTKILRNTKLMPTIGSWYKRLCRKAEMNISIEQKYHYEYLVKYMRDYIKELDGSISYYDGQTNLDIKSDIPFISFNLSKSNNDFEKLLGQQILLAWLWEKYCKTNSEDKIKASKKRIILDEAWRLLPYSEASDFAASMFLRLPIKNISFIVISEMGEFQVENEKFQKILKDTSIKLLFKQDETHIESLNRFFGLTNGEIKYLKKCFKSEGILQIGTNSVQIYFPASELEADYIDVSNLGFVPVSEMEEIDETIEIKTS
ncbi:MAG: VirB4 family type IV secretion system protein [Deltaproteobacteria bacterium]